MPTGLVFLGDDADLLIQVCSRRLERVPLRRSCMSRRRSRGERLLLASASISGSARRSGDRPARTVRPRSNRNARISVSAISSRNMLAPTDPERSRRTYPRTRATSRGHPKRGRVADPLRNDDWAGSWKVTSLRTAARFIFRSALIDHTRGRYFQKARRCAHIRDPSGIEELTRAGVRPAVVCVFATHAATLPLGWPGHAGSGAFPVEGLLVTVARSSSHRSVARHHEVRLGDLRNTHVTFDAGTIKA
jgi:hypothetical protein